MKTVPRSVGEWLQHRRDLASLRRRCQIHERLLQAVRRNVPEPLCRHCLACVLDGRGKLTVYVTSAAWATRLRYCQAPLLAALRSEFPIRGFRVRIWMTESAVHRPPPRAKIPSPAVVSRLEQALSTFSEPQLQRSLAGLVGALRQREGDRKS